MITDQPASVSTSAAVAPAGPVPMTTASQSRVGSVTAAHLFVGVAAGLHVAGELDRDPARAVGVAAVLGRAVRAFARVRRRRAARNSRVGVQATVLLVAVDVEEVGAERGDAVAVDRPASRASGR